MKDIVTPSFPHLFFHGLSSCWSVTVPVVSKLRRWKVSWYRSTDAKKISVRCAICF